MIKQKMTLLIKTQKQKQLLMKVTLMIYLNQSIMELYQTFLEKGSCRIIDSVIDHNINIPKYNRLAGSSYMQITRELDHPRIGLINIQNIDDNECFKWCLVRYLNPADNHFARITKVDKDFAKKLDFRDIKFPVKVRYIHKIEKK